MTTATSRVQAPARRGARVRAETPPQLAVQGFAHPATGSVSYVVADHAARSCAIIDPVLDFDSRNARVRTDFADRLAAHVQQHDLQLAWILETDVHTAHLSAAQYLKQALGGAIAIGERVREMQKTVKYLFNLDGSFVPNGSHFDHLFADREPFTVGGIELRALHTPGHTPACTSYLGEALAFTGNTLYAPEAGTARADLPWSNARSLYRSIRKLQGLAEDTRLFTCRDTGAGDGVSRWQSTVFEQRIRNPLLRDDLSEDAFVRWREARDRVLEPPALLCPALQVNVRAGRLPEPEANGIAYFKLPVNVFR